MSNPAPVNGAPAVRYDPPQNELVSPGDRLMLPPTNDNAT
jgi:hypothetical protein